MKSLWNLMSVGMSDTLKDRVWRQLERIGLADATERFPEPWGGLYYWLGLL